MGNHSHIVTVKILYTEKNHNYITLTFTDLTAQLVCLVPKVTALLTGKHRALVTATLGASTLAYPIPVTAVFGAGIEGGAVVRRYIALTDLLSQLIIQVPIRTVRYTGA